MATEYHPSHFAYKTVNGDRPCEVHYSNAKLMITPMDGGGFNVSVVWHETHVRVETTINQFSVTVQT